MTCLVGALLLCRVARRPVPAVLLAAVAFVALAPNRRLPPAERQSLAHALEAGLRR